MGLFDKFKKKDIYNFDLAYEGKPEFYVGKDGKSVDLLFEEEENE